MNDLIYEESIYQEDCIPLVLYAQCIFDCFIEIGKRDIDYWDY